MNEKATEKQVKYLKQLWNEFIQPLESRTPSDDQRLDAFVYMVRPIDWANLSKKNASIAINILQRSAGAERFFNNVVGQNAYGAFGHVGDTFRVMMETMPMPQGKTINEYAWDCDKIANQRRADDLLARLMANETEVK